MSGNAIPSHHTITPSSSTLTINLDFSAYPNTFWAGEDFIPYRASLLSKLPHYTGLVKKLLILITTPHHRTQSNSIRLTQRDLVARIVGLLSRSDLNEVELDIVYQYQEVEWSQVRCLAPFWGLDGKVRGWKVRVKERDREARVLAVGSELGTKLQAEWKRMKEGKELY
jgi:hypothetical protein